MIHREFNKNAPRAIQEEFWPRALVLTLKDSWDSRHLLFLSSWPLVPFYPTDSFEETSSSQPSPPGLGLGIAWPIRISLISTYGHWFRDRHMTQDGPIRANQHPSPGGLAIFSVDNVSKLITCQRGPADSHLATGTERLPQKETNAKESREMKKSPQDGIRGLRSIPSP